jgi:phosphoribosylamine--glycine ligase
MIVKDEPFLIEYNVRMGDPECQTILPKLKTDLSQIFLSCCNGELDQINIEWMNKKSLCVVLCSKGYPDEFKKNIEIQNLKNINLSSNGYLFHAGTLKRENKIFAIGGRVLNFVTLSENFTDAKKDVYKNINDLDWKDGFCRKDIGYKVIS